MHTTEEIQPTVNTVKRHHDQVMLTTMLASIMFGSVQTDSINNILIPCCFVKNS